MNIHPGLDAMAHVIKHDALYTDIHDKQRHLGTMRAVAEELARPVEEIAGLYEEVLMQLKEQAAIHDYLPVLVSKRVKQIYRQHYN